MYKGKVYVSSFIELKNAMLEEMHNVLAIWLSLI
jgi:hypothetical protein